MARSVSFLAATVVLILITSTASAQPVMTDGKYVLIGWNDLGMHCISPRFEEMAILPPYNTIRAIVIKRGEEPDIVTSNLQITYRLKGNTTVAGKTDFWQFAPQLFGQQLPTGIGLTGLGLSGTMGKSGKQFVAEGIPALPFNDKMVWNPYQQAELNLTGVGGLKANARTTVIVPVSDEMHCEKCHATGKVAARNIRTPTVEGNILTLHDKLEKTHLMSQRPVLCASCHSDPALGAPGKKGVSSMSLAMHRKHSKVANQPSCYDCHPGVKTHCNRSAIKGMRAVGSDPHCEDCHGGLKKMTATLVAGRQPWAQEPTCAQCHGAKYSTGATLYRNARGHGGVPCVACHNSPHAWWPSTRSDDNLQPVALQKNNHAIGYKACNVCHTGGRTGTIPPHGDDDDDDD